jgi:hypothetical protein
MVVYLRILVVWSIDLRVELVVVLLGMLIGLWFVRLEVSIAHLQTRESRNSQRNKIQLLNKALKQTMSQNNERSITIFSSPRDVNKLARS